MGLLGLVFPTAQSQQLQGGMGHGGPQLLLAVLMAGPPLPPSSLSRGWERGRGGGLRHGTPLPGGCALLLWHWGLSLLPLLPRLIKGDGEVLEEIVTKERHKEINKVSVTSLPRAHPQPRLFLTCLLLCAFFSSKPPGGTAWPSRCEQGCCPEGPAGQGLWIVLAQEGGRQKPGGGRLPFLLGTGLRPSLFSDAGWRVGPLSCQVPHF